MDPAMARARTIAGVRLRLQKTLRERLDRQVDVERAADLAARVHAEHRRSDVDRRDPELRGRDRPDRAPAREIAARDEALRRVADLPAERLEARGRGALGRVRLV